MYWTVPMNRGPVQSNAYFLYCAAGDKVYYFGGFYIGKTYYADQIDVHIFNTVSLRWSKLPAGDKVSYFGGLYNGKTYDGDRSDVHVFNTVSLRWSKLPPMTRGKREERPRGFVPPMSWGHTAVLIEHRIYVWGGVVNCKTTKEISTWVTVTGDYWDNNVFYVFHVDSVHHRWSKHNISGTVPGARAGHSASVLGKVMFIYGGWNRLTGYTNDIYKLDTATMVWSLVITRGTQPPDSVCHSATIIGTKMFVFGGWGGMGEDYNNISVFDTETSCWLSTLSPANPPEKRWLHSAFAYDGELYIFGGYSFGLKCYFSDLWKLNPETVSWTKVQPKGKAPDWTSTKWCCLKGDRIIVFGGYDTTNAQPILQILELSPSLKTLCKLAVIQYGLEQSGLPHNIKWELAAMTMPTTEGIHKQNIKLD